MLVPYKFIWGDEQPNPHTNNKEKEAHRESKTVTTKHVFVTKGIKKYIEFCIYHIIEHTNNMLNNISPLHNKTPKLSSQVSTWYTKYYNTYFILFTLQKILLLRNNIVLARCNTLRPLGM